MKQVTRSILGTMMLTVATGLLLTAPVAANPGRSKNADDLPAFGPGAQYHPVIEPRDRKSVV